MKMIKLFKIRTKIHLSVRKREMNILNFNSSIPTSQVIKSIKLESRPTVKIKNRFKAIALFKGTRKYQRLESRNLR